MGHFPPLVLQGNPLLYFCFELPRLGGWRIIQISTKGDRVSSAHFYGGTTGLSLTSQAQNPALVTVKAIGIEKAIVESSNTFVG